MTRPPGASFDSFIPREISGMSEMNLITLARFVTHDEAEVLKQLLESAGIQVHLSEPKESGPRGFALQVADEDVQRVEDILAQMGDSSETEERDKTWRCDDCSAINDVGMRECWACGPEFEGFDTEESESEWPEVESPMGVDFSIAHRKVGELNPSDLYEITRYAAPIEADLVKNRLEAVGVRTWLEGDATATWFWYFQNAIGGVKLLVAGEDVKQAIEILTEIEEEISTDDELPAWECSQCEASVTGDMQVCWYCGTSSDGIENPDFKHASAPGEPLIRERHEAGPISPWFVMAFVLCLPLLLVYAFVKTVFMINPEVLQRELAEEEQARLPQSKTEMGFYDSVTPEPENRKERIQTILCQRALLAGVLGYAIFLSPFPYSGSFSMFFFLAPFFSVYSIILLFKYDLMNSAFHRKSPWKVYTAMMFNLLMCCIYGVIWLNVTSQFDLYHYLMGPRRYFLY